LYKIVLLYLNANNCVDHAHATDPAERYLSDACRATVGDAEAMLQSGHALHLGATVLLMSQARDARRDLSARSGVRHLR